MWKNFMKKRQGFTMIEMLLALMATSITTLLITQIVSVLLHSNKKDYRVEDDLAIKQMQLIFAQGSAYDVSSASCGLTFHNKQITFEQYEDKLIKRSGFEIFLQEIEDVSFFQEGGCVYVAWMRDGKSKQAPLGCE